jgi:monofunctional biosynthetic peptidoglycan transglycosylase
MAAPAAYPVVKPTETRADLQPPLQRGLDALREAFGMAGLRTAAHAAGAAWKAAWQQFRFLPYAERARHALRYVRLALRAAAIAVAGLVVAVLALVVAYRWVNPPMSTLMLGQRFAGMPIERTWVPLERISPNLVRAVVLSEDAAFCRHRGVDLAALKEAMESARGGSTITMQVVKNLFLWPSRSYVRKAIEIALAYLVDALWPKRRILEVYLNIAEWGDGVFGAESAAQTHFGKRASRLTADEAALLAVSLPNPIERTAGYPGLGTSRLAGRLLIRMAASRADLSCIGVRQLDVRPAPRPAPKAVPKPAQKPDQWEHLFPGRD